MGEKGLVARDRKAVTGCGHSRLRLKSSLEQTILKNVDSVWDNASPTLLSKTP